MEFLASSRWLTGVTPLGTKGGLALPAGWRPEAMVVAIASGRRLRDGKNNAPLAPLLMPRNCNGSGPNLRWGGAGNGCSEGAHTWLRHSIVLGENCCELAAICMVSKGGAAPRARPEDCVGGAMPRARPEEAKQGFSAVPETDEASVGSGIAGA